MTGILVLGILVAVVGGIIFLLNRSSRNPNTRVGYTLLVVGGLAIVVSVIASLFTTVPAGSVGVVVRFGGVTGAALPQGLQTKAPFIDTIVRMSIKTEVYSARATAASQDLQDVETDIAVNYHLNADAAVDVYRTLGLNYMETIAAPAVQETVKEITAKYLAEDLILRRDTVKAAITDSLTQRLQGRGHRGGDHFDHELQVQPGLLGRHRGKGGRFAGRPGSAEQAGTGEGGSAAGGGSGQGSGKCPDRAGNR